MCNALHPPVKPGLSVHFPVVKRISPQLSRCRKAIRRTASYLRGLIVFIQLKQPGACPCICAVHGNIDGNISNDPDSLFIGIRFQLPPLLIKFKLHVLLKFDIKIQLFPVIIQGVLPAQTDILRPLRPGNSSETVLHRHKQCIILQPVSLFLLESHKIRILTDIAALICLSKQLQPALIYFFIINAGRIISEIHTVTFLLCENSLFDQILQTDKIGISGKGGKGLVGRIPIAGWPQRKNLPAALSSCLQCIYKLICAFGKASDSVF